MGSAHAVRMLRVAWWRRVDVELIRAGLTFAVARSWKERVQPVLDRNKRLGRRPASQTEVSNAVGRYTETMFGRRGTESGAGQPCADTGLTELALMAWCLGLETRDLVADDATLIAHATRAVCGPGPAGGLLVGFPDAMAYARLAGGGLRGDALDPAAVAAVWEQLTRPPAAPVPAGEAIPPDHFPAPATVAAAAWRVAERLAGRIGDLFADRR